MSGLINNFNRAFRIVVSNLAVQHSRFVLFCFFCFFVGFFVGFGFFGGCSFVFCCCCLGGGGGIVFCVL